jgi:hypothetical protein
MEFNILIGDGILEDLDKRLFFGPLEDWDKFIKLDLAFRFPQLMRQLGIFPSTSQAMKQGWNKDIPCGFSEWKIGQGKNLKRIFILKILDKSLDVDTF